MMLRRALLAVLLSCLAPWAGAQQEPPPVGPLQIPAQLPEPARADLPTLMLIGDSTVRNGRDDGQGLGEAGQWGWGHPLADFFDASRINVVNRAIGGLSSRTYLTGGHWARSLALLKRGDWLLIQFGHNDSSPVNDDKRARGTLKGVGEDTESIQNLLTGQPELVHSYGWYLRQFIQQARAKGVQPVLVSPIPRKRWGEDGKIVRTSASYAGWAAQVAQAEGLPLIDLDALVAQRYDQLGREAVMQLFPTPTEHTHPNFAGSLLNAQIVLAELQRQRLLPASVYLPADRVRIQRPVATRAAEPAPVAASAAQAPSARVGAAREDERPVVDASKIAREAPRDPALPSLFIVGDSTVRSAGQGGAYGWGEFLAESLDTRRLNVVNHAIGGRSSRSFWVEGRWQAVLSQLKAGDWVLIQFGHNDGGRVGDPAMKRRASLPGVGPETQDEPKPDGTPEAVHSFGWYLSQYVMDARAKGARVVLLSPIPHKDRWQSGRDFESHAQWAQQVAREQGAEFIDLTLLVAEGYRAIGQAQADSFFSDARTHTNAAGARFNAAKVIEGLKGLPGRPLASFFLTP